MLKKLMAAVAARVAFLTYVAGACLISFGASYAYPPAGPIAGGILLIALVVETGGKP